MKKKSFVLFLFSALCFSPIFCKGIDFVSNASVIITLDEITEEDLMVLKENRDHKKVLECPKGIVIPFAIDLKGKYLTSLNDKNNCFWLKTNQTLYIKCIDDEFLFSDDMLEWETFSNFFSKNLKFDLKMEGDIPHPVIHLQFELNH